MRYVTFIPPAHIHTAHTAVAVYSVVTNNEHGTVGQTVEVVVDFIELRDLARKAVDNVDGVATLHYGAIIARVKK